MAESTPESLLAALRERVVVADGAMGTMLQAYDLSLDDFEGHEGCNEILNVTRPDVVRDVHEAYLRVGCDAVETNTFGANLANLGEYGIADRIHELSVSAARIAREVTDDWSTPDQPRRDERAPALSLPACAHRRLLHAQRWPAATDLRRRPLPAHTGAAGRRARPVHTGVRARACRWLLRDDARAPAGRRRAGGRPS